MLGELIILFLIESIILSLSILAIKWEKIEIFFHERYTYFNLLFVALYFLEQAIFILSSYLYPEHISILVGFFALIVLSTVALQSITMESKNKKANEKLERYTITHTEKVNEIRKEYELKINELRNQINKMGKIISSKRKIKEVI